MKRIIALVIALLLVSGVSRGKKQHEARPHTKKTEWHSPPEILYRDYAAAQKEKGAKIAFVIGLAGFVMLFFVCPILL